MSPTNVLYLVLATVAGAAIGAWVAGSRIEAPAEVAARTAPPPPSPIFVPVEQRVLSADVVMRGTVRFGLPQPVSIVPSTLKGAPALVATLPLPNARFAEGDVILTASGRPVFLLEGQTHTYRDLAPGVVGEDVRQLKLALQRLGFDPGSADNIYDQQTGEAVAQFYRSKGFDPFGPTPTQIAATRALERELADAVRARMAAVSAVTTSAQAVSAARAAAGQANQAAALERTARADDQRRLLEARQTGKSLTVENERARAAYADTAAAADIANQIAEQSLIALDPRQPETARIAANAKLELAKAARRKAQLESQLAIEAAERDLALANERIRLANAAAAAAYQEGERSIRAALEAQKLADLDLKTATERANQSAADLDAAKRKLGVQFPADEVVFIANLPVRIEAVSATVGASAAGPVLSVTDNQLAVDSALPLDAAQLVKPGMPVAIDEQTLGIRTSGVVTMVAPTPGTRGVDGYHVYFETRVDKTTQPIDRVSVRLTIPIKTTQGAVTAVPVSAVSLAADGTSRVQVDNKGVLEYVAVTPGLSAGGYVEVTGSKLGPGQLVVVGYKNQERGS
jgi:peptidoglycan hydrolase-like protein with peptidoglycan-binding domain/multidrug efflux pump subunit AcrA (membrane-fusion protein)